jgi:hypothetical protein
VSINLFDDDPGSSQWPTCAVGRSGCQVLYRRYPVSDSNV